MVKKNKAFSKIFKAGPAASKGGLLAGADDYDDSEGDLIADELNGSGTAGAFDDDFPIAPKVMRDGSTDDIFVEENHSEHSTSQPGAGDEDDVEINFDAAFDASFSKVGDAVTASASNLDETNIAGSNHSDGKKKGRRITQLFMKEKLQVPVERCGEIVVDKSKIPTNKVDLEVQNGELVINNPEAGENDNEASLDRRTSHGMGGGMLKCLLYEAWSGWVFWRMHCHFH